MSSSLSLKEWMLVAVVNVLVSALTTWIVVRVLTTQPRILVTEPARAAVAAPAPTAQPISAAPTAQLVAVPTAQSAAATKPAAAPATAIAAPTVAPAAAPAVAAQPGSVRVASVTFPGQRQREFIALVNEGETQSLFGWALQSSRGMSFTLPNVTVFKDGFLNIYTTAGTNSATEVFIGRTEAAWQAGDVITLAKDGQVVSRFEVK